MFKENYVRYLKEIRNSSDSTVGHYINAINIISKYLMEMNIINKTIFEITEIEELENIREILIQDKNFIEKDDRGHRMYTSGLNNYCRFAIGEGLKSREGNEEIFDYITPRGEVIETTHSSWKRSSIMKWQSIQMANYHCEINHSHQTFVSRSNNNPYMEGHHIIPIRLQKEYENNIDVHANIICLCPLCHKLLHYGLNDERATLLKLIYTERHTRLENCGIEVSKKDFIESIIKCS